MPDTIPSREELSMREEVCIFAGNGAGKNFAVETNRRFVITATDMDMRLVMLVVISVLHPYDDSVKTA